MFPFDPFDDLDMPLQAFDGEFVRFGRHLLEVKVVSDRVWLITARRSRCEIDGWLFKLLGYAGELVWIACPVAATAVSLAA
jgi:hypothetical protein